MASFTIRVELHNATRGDYETLYRHLAEYNITDTLVCESGTRHKLPTAEYNYEGAATYWQVLETIKWCAAKTARPYSILVTEASNRAWHGLQLPVARRAAAPAKPRRHDDNGGGVRQPRPCYGHSRAMPRLGPLPLCFALLAFGACGGERPHAQPALDPAPHDGADTATAGAAPASAAPASAPPPGAPNVPPPPGPPGGDTGPPKPPPRSWAVSKNGKAFLRIIDEPGRIIDTNAPPPPPGVTIPPHPFLSAECGGGEIQACSKAGELLRASSSTKEFLAKLRSAGFDVRELKPGTP